MYSFTKHNYGGDILAGFADTHSHVLPAVDDGATDVECSLELLDRLEQCGVAKMFLTPHIKAGRFANDESELREKFEQLKYEGSVELHLAAEYFTDSELVGHIKNRPLTFADGSLLTEFSFTILGLGSMDTLFELSLMGHTVIIAHPERYLFLTEQLLYQFLHSGYKLQLTIPSIIGFYGAQVQQTALKLLEDGVYSYLGSDIHNINYAESICQAQLQRKIFDRLNRLKSQNEELY